MVLTCCVFTFPLNDMCTPFVLCCTDLYTWALILLWSNIAGHMLDLYSSPLYPFWPTNWKCRDMSFILP